MLVEVQPELTDKHGKVLKPRKRARGALGGPGDVAFTELRYWAAHWREIADPAAREAKRQWLLEQNAQRDEAAARRAFHARYGYAYQFPADAVANLEAGKGFIAEPKK